MMEAFKNDDQLQKAHQMAWYFWASPFVRILGTKSGWRKTVGGKVLCHLGFSSGEKTTWDHWLLCTLSFCSWHLCTKLALTWLDYYSLREDVGPRASPLHRCTVRRITKAFAHFLLLFGTLRRRTRKHSSVVCLEFEHLLSDSLHRANETKR